MWCRFTPEAQRAVIAAQVEAAREGRRQISPAHLLLGALDCSAAAPVAEDEQGDAETAAARTVQSLDVEPQLLRLAVQTRLSAIPPPRSGAREPGLSNAAVRAMERAAQEARRLKSPHIGSEHLLLGVARIRAASLPWHLVLLGELRRMGLLSESRWLELRRPSRTTHLVAAEILDEFRLDLASLRIAAAGEGCGGASLKWTNEVQRLVERAAREARSTGAGRVGAEHLWLGLLAEPESAAGGLLHASGISVGTLEKHLRAALRADAETAGPHARYTAEARRIFESAERVARSAHCRYIGSDHLLMALAGAAPPSPPTARESLRKIVAAEPPSRAEAAIVRALEAQGLPPDYLSQALSQWGDRANETAKEPTRAMPSVKFEDHLLAFLTPGLLWMGLLLLSDEMGVNSVDSQKFLFLAQGILPFGLKCLPRSLPFRVWLDGVFKTYLFTWAFLALVRIAVVCLTGM